MCGEHEVCATALVLLFIMSTSPVLHRIYRLRASCTTTQAIRPVSTSASRRSVEYTSSTDEAKYKMFSSNHPILGFNRPAELFVIDAMVNVSATLTISVENIGTASSGTVDVNVLLLHDDYDYFEFVNSTTQMAPFRAEEAIPYGSVVPGYAGNHTLPFVSRQPFLTTIQTTTSDNSPSPSATRTSTAMLRHRGRLGAVGCFDGHVDLPRQKLPRRKRAIVELQQQRHCGIDHACHGHVGCVAQPDQNQRRVVFLHRFNSSER